MSLVPLTDQNEIDRAFATLCKTLNQGSRVVRRKVGWQGGNGEYDLQWNAFAGFWTMQEQFEVRNRHILLLGTQNPELARMVGIVCEVNPPRSGINRRCAGILLKDQDHNIYLAHSGKIGGGRAGIGKGAMLQDYAGSWQTVSWPDKKSSQAIVIGKIDSPLLPGHVALFAREVQRIKEGIGTSLGAIAPSTPPPAFTPEFAGRRRSYTVTSPIEADCDHGLIINSLAEELRTRNLRFNRDQNRDLFIYGDRGAMRLLFEAKSETTTSTIYQGIGQLLFHSANQNPRPLLVFVLPESPDASTLTVLNRLGIHVLSFDWENNMPVFSNLSDILRLAG
jgi:hypothetical protein